ncbi:MAG: ribonucleoside-diphosphate reductase subunit alpha, partial [Candidatus Micrarchaeota archaeon]|nr:ribonucleoside-diphosphate reductase subunit alpha [Candidatus Micrarchaeota archaeon]
WKMGLKTTYYLRTLAVSQIEKSTLDAGKFGYTQKRDYASQEAVQEPKPMVVQSELAASTFVQAPAKVLVPATDVSSAKTCSILDPDCEACQ